MTLPERPQRPTAANPTRRPTSANPTARPAAPAVSHAPVAAPANPLQGQVLHGQLEQQKRQAMVKRYTTLGDKMEASIKAAEVGERRVVTESIFKTYFLDLFSGQLAPELRQERMHYWRQIAGTPYDEVQIVSDVSGEPLHVVPGIHNRALINTNAAPIGQQSMTDVAREARHKALISPDLEDQILFGTLAKRFLVKPEEANKAHIERWETLLKAYGRSLDPNRKVAMAQGAKSSGLQASKASDVLSDDDLEF